MEYKNLEESIVSKLNPTCDANLGFYARKDGREYMLGLNLFNVFKRANSRWMLLSFMGTKKN